MSKKKLVAPKTKEQIELFRLEKERKLKTWKAHVEKHPGEFVHMTRRELLNSGVIASASYLAMPSLFGVLPQFAHGQAAPVVCDGGGAGTGLVPFIHLNLAGGYSSLGNMFPVDVNGAPLASMATNGVTNTPVRDIGGALWSTRSQTVGMLAGINATIGGAKPNTVAALSCTGSNDDNGNDPFSIMGAVLKAGLKGTAAVLPFMGTQNSRTGVGAAPVPAVTAPPAPLVVNNINAITGAVSVQGALANMTPAQRTKLFEVVGKLNASQARRLASLNAATGLEALLKCADDKNLSLSANAGALVLNVNQNPAIAALWAADNLRGSMIHNVLTGNAPACAINLGGYDYHGNNRAGTDAQDNTAGQLIGRILQSAQLLGTPVFIHLTSDGAVSTGAVDGNWSSDAGNRSAQGIFAYNPAAPPKILKQNPAAAGQTLNQLGAISAAQTSLAATPVGASADRGAMAIFANWVLYSTGKLDLLNSVAPGYFSAADQQYISLLSR